jgi:aminoglycoside/choline kinase family phosphotransferase
MTIRKSDAGLTVPATPRSRSMTTDTRADELRAWLARTCPDAHGPLTPITGDASFRRYFRIHTDAGERIVMDSPPDREPAGPFVDIAERLETADVSAPRVLARDRERGFLLLSDLGDRLYLDELDAGSADTLYADALDTLVRMQATIPTTGLEPYDASRLNAEMDLFPVWFLGEHLGLDADRVGDEPARTFAALTAAALEQPRVFVHRDYHSRNLMVLADGNPGVLDFQDAVAGPVTYDLVSLLRDCYIDWPERRVSDWIERYREAALARGIELPAGGALRRWFDLMGAQRHLKAIGIFARLWHRDGKPRYLADIPRTWGYIEALFGRYPELEPLARFAHRVDLRARLEHAEAPAQP